MRWYVTPILLTLVSCAGGEIEGDEALECSDGADNDQNGYFDCDDLGCANSPDCDGTNTDDGNDTGNNNDTGNGDSGGPNCNDGTGPFSHVNSVDLTMVLNLNIDENNSFCAYLETLGAVSDCEMTWTGTADEVLERCRPPERITMDGTFTRTASTCDPNPGDGQPGIVEQGSWGNEDGDTSSFISFVMDEADPGFMYAVVAHESATRWEVVKEDPATQKQYAIYDMASYEFSAGQTEVVYSEIENIIIQNCPHTFTSSVTATFNQ